MKEIDSLRRHLVDLLTARNAHVDLDGALKGLPVKLRGVKPKGAEHTAWQLVEHIRIATWDILEFSRNKKHVSPAWPDGYWPTTAAPPSGAAWNKSVRQIRADLESMKKLVCEQKERPISSHCARQRSNAATGSTVGGGPQRVPYRATGFAAAITGRVAGPGSGLRAGGWGLIGARGFSPESQVPSPYVVRSLGDCWARGGEVTDCHFSQCESICPETRAPSC